MSANSDKYVWDLDDEYARFLSENATRPKYLVLPMEVRYAIKSLYNFARDIKCQESIIGDIDTYMGIPVIKKEECIIV